MQAAETQDPFPLPSHSLDAEARACWGLAGWIGMHSSDDHLRSYTSLLLALLHGDNALSRWLLRYARAAGLALDEIYASRQLRPQDLPELKARLARGEVPEGKPAFTTSVKNMTEGAADLLRMTDASELGVRHLLGAYLYRVPEVHRKQMEAWGFDLQREGSAFVRQMRARHPEEAERWEKVHVEALSTPPDLEARDPLPPPKISSFAADTPEGEDHLNIEDDVYALSALICSTRVSPPLSIGLFGDWGSGKSFFIRRLQRGVAWISQDARESGRLQKEVPFFKRVVQIEFNAWNYSGGNLWASLVQHILENLRLAPDERQDLVDKRVAHLKRQMQLEQEVLDAAAVRQQEAQKEVTSTEQRLGGLRELHRERVTELKKVLAKDVLEVVKLPPGAVKQLNELRAELNLPLAESRAGEFLAAVEGARHTLSRFSALFEYVPKKQRKRFIVNSALVLVAPPVLAVAVGLLVGLIVPQVGSLTVLVGWASGTLAFGARWLRQRTEDLAAPLAKLEGLQAQARQRVEAEQQRFRAEAASLEQQIALAKDEILAAQAKQQEALSNLQRIEAELASTTPARVLADFVRERSQSEDYRQHLGLPAVIRRDFENISAMVARENKALDDVEDLAQEEAQADERINRIVLYIDDLDRCPEPLVIDVLKAVHLLLAFPLFVVVVAVDARWVSRSLARQFPGLLTDQRPGRPRQRAARHGHATPSDYLEKIFQIPFWLRAPDEEAVVRMVRGLVRENLPEAPAAAAGGAGGDGAADPPVSEAAQPVFKRRPHDRNATALDVQPVELATIERLAPVLGRSPRALKRFINVYRLLKASLSAEEEDGFFEERDGVAPFEAVLLLLAVVNGLPAVSGPLVAALLGVPQGDGEAEATLAATLSQLERAGDAATEQHARLTDWLDDAMPDWEDVPITVFRHWARRVARYSYHLHHA